MGQLDSISFSQNITVHFAEFMQQSSQQDCVVDNPDLSYCITNSSFTLPGSEAPFTSTNEVVQRGDRLWIRLEGEDWVESSPDIIEEQGLDQGALEQLQVSDFITGAEIVDEVVVDGATSYVIEFDLDTEAYFGFILGEEESEQFLAEAEDAQGSGTMWIGVEDQRLHKMAIFMSFTVDGEVIEMEVQSSYYDFNKPVSIPDPGAEGAGAGMRFLQLSFFGRK